MLLWLRSFCGDIRSGSGKAADVDGLVGPATDVPPRLWALDKSKNESSANTGNNLIDIVTVKLNTPAVNSGQFAQTQQA